MAIVTGVLETAASIFERFRAPDAAVDLMPLKVALDVFAAPLTSTFTAIDARITAALAAGATRELAPLFNVRRRARRGAARHRTRTSLSAPPLLRPQALRTMCTCFYLLNLVDLPEFFEDNIRTWMTFFHRYLELRAPALASAVDDAEPGPLELVQAEVVECVGLYAEMYETEFAPFMATLVDDVWKLVSTMGPAQMLAPNMDNLVSRSVRVLSAVIAKPALAASFDNEATLSGIVARIVVPNMTLRASDLEALEDNPVNFIRGDIEGSDSDTRRRVASDLVRALARHKPERVTPIVMAVIAQLLADYDVDKAARAGSKDVAVALLMAVAIKTTTAAAGVTSVNECVSLADMLRVHVLPELAGSSVDERPLARAACIKFVATFRGLFGRDELQSLLPLLAALLGSRHYVVHTYAAAAIERILCVKDAPAAAADGGARARAEPRVTIGAVVPLIAPVLGALFARMAGTTGEDNEYLMRCVMRIVAFAKDKCAGVTSNIMTALTTVLGRVCRNPMNPTFNHYLFESIGALIRATCTATPSAVADFEALLFPPFQVVLANDVVEFLPYVFQLLAVRRARALGGDAVRS